MGRLRQRASSTAAVKYLKRKMSRSKTRPRNQSNGGGEISAEAPCGVEMAQRAHRPASVDFSASSPGINSINPLFCHQDESAKEGEQQMVAEDATGNALAEEDGGGAGRVNPFRSHHHPTGGGGAGGVNTTVSSMSVKTVSGRDVRVRGEGGSAPERRNSPWNFARDAEASLPTTD